MMKPGALKALILPALLLALAGCKPGDDAAEGKEKGRFDASDPRNRPEPARFGARQEAQFSPEARSLIERTRSAAMTGAAVSPEGGADRWASLFDGSGARAAFTGPANDARIGTLMDREGVSGHIVDAVLTESRAQGADPLLVFSVIKQESQFDSRAHSPKGARGLMQIMPGTGRDLGVRNPANLYDPRTNIQAGVRYLKGLFDQFSDVSMTQLALINPFADNGVKAAIAAYNAGPGAVQKYDGVPPYRETRDYVVKVLSNYDGYRRQLTSI